MTQPQDIRARRARGDDIFGIDVSSIRTVTSLMKIALFTGTLAHMTTANLEISKATLDWSDFRTVRQGTYGEEDAEAGAVITVVRTRDPSVVRIRVRHVANVERGAEHTPSLLRHEQGHLDMAIIAARLMKVDIDAGVHPEIAFHQHGEAYLAANHRYDDMTAHGRDTGAQASWNTALQIALAQEPAPCFVNTVLL